MNSLLINVKYIVNLEVSIYNVHVHGHKLPYIYLFSGIPLIIKMDRLIFIHMYAYTEYCKGIWISTSTPVDKYSPSLP